MAPGTVSGAGWSEVLDWFMWLSGTRATRERKPAGETATVGRESDAGEREIGFRESDGFRKSDAGERETGGRESDAGERDIGFRESEGFRESIGTEGHRLPGERCGREGHQLPGERRPPGERCGREGYRRPGFGVVGENEDDRVIERRERRGSGGGTNITLTLNPFS